MSHRAKPKKPAKASTTLTPAARAVLDAMQALPEADRRLLFKHLERLWLDRAEWLLDYAIIPGAILYVNKIVLQVHRDTKKRLEDQLAETEEKIARHKKGPRVRAERTKTRNEHIDSLLVLTQPGDEDWPKVHEQVGEHDQTLLRGHGGKLMAVDMMRKKYLQARPDRRKAIQERRRET
jgi:hypothetical protein